MINATKSIKLKINSFLSNQKEYPLIAALAAGLYPLLHNYNSNFTLVNSWSQVLFFISMFLIVPIVVFLLVSYGIKRIKWLGKFQKYTVPILNLTVFVFLIIISTYGLKKKMLALALIIAIVLAIVLYKHIKKIIILQLLLAIIAMFYLIPVLLIPINYSNEWMKLDDAIEHVKFKKKPNIYLIQPDGYANFSELKNANYNFDNSEFETFLTATNFKMYQNFRSNYFSTLSSNSSMFAMNHHYYSNVKGQVHELYKARKIIVGDNPVVSIFKKNEYKTFLLLQKSYFLVNRSKILYDYCNIDYNEVPFMARGFGVTKDVNEDLVTVIKTNKSTNNFHFIQHFSPGHISTYKNKSQGKEEERAIYIDKLKEANTWLKEIIQLIVENDPDAIVVMIADHGGFVGLDYTMQTKTKLTDSELINSVFTSALAIRWPDNSSPHYDDHLKTSVNLFRVLFSYLSENEAYLNHLEDDKSYLQIKEGAPKGVYEVINNNGDVVFKKTTN